LFQIIVGRKINEVKPTKLKANKSKKKKKGEEDEDGDGVGSKKGKSNQDKPVDLENSVQPVSLLPYLRRFDFKVTKAIPNLG
jgi:hypothetical protein